MLNNNFNELVRKYKRYRAKRREMVLLSILGFIVVVVGGIFLVTRSEFVNKSFQMTTPESEVKVQHELNNTDKLATKTEEKIEEPIKKIEVETPKSQDLPNQVYSRSAKELQDGSSLKLEVDERKNLYKLLTTDKRENSYQSAVDIAEFYFKDKNYQQSVIWSVKASKKDPKESLPWIIYAKSKIALGKPKVAQKALAVYLKHTESKEVRELFESLK